jgi:hypothetical protein
MKTKFFVAAAVAALSLAGAAQASSPILSISSNTGETLGNGPFTLGWEFTLRTTIKVTGLGVFDDSLDGLAESHDVGLWDTSGNLLTSGTVGSGTAGTLIDNFRYVNVKSVTLGPGTYEVGAVWDNGLDPMLFPGDAGTLTTASGVFYNQGVFVAGGSLAFPSSGGGQSPSYLGPNVLAGGVPEPASWALMLIGLGGLGAALRSRRSQAAVLA